MQKPAVLHQNKYLFVLFGANSQGSPTDGFYTISLDNNQWVGNPTNGDTPASNGGGGADSSGSSSPSSLHGGAIAGIIVACLIVVCNQENPKSSLHTDIKRWIYRVLCY